VVPPLPPTRWRRDEQELLRAGIDPRLRARVLPHAVKALVGSLLLTCCAAAGGFYALKAAGLVARDTARVATLSETVHALRGAERRPAGPPGGKQA